LKTFGELLPGTAGLDLSKRGLDETVLRRRGDLWLNSCIGPFLVLLHVHVPGTRAVRDPRHKLVNLLEQANET